MLFLHATMHAPQLDEKTRSAKLRFRTERAQPPCPSESYLPGGLTGVVTGDLTLKSTRPVGPWKVPWAFMKKIATTAIKSAPTRNASHGVTLLPLVPVSVLTT